VDGDLTTPVIKVATLAGAHEVRTYGPSRGLNSPPGPTLAPDDSGLPSLAYVDSRQQPRLITLSWMDAVPPKITATAVSPTIGTTPGGSATYTFHASDNSSSPVSYAVAYRTHTADGFGSWVEPPSWSALDEGPLTDTVTAGTTTCFRVRATDGAGNTSAWSDESCSTSPLDDRALSPSSHVSLSTDSSAMLGTDSVMTKKGATLTLKNQQFHGVYVYAMRGPNEGSINVYAGRTKLGSVSLKSSKSGYARFLVTSSKARSADVQLVSNSSKPARVDGIALVP
jgi:hypothetical protein